MLIAKNDPINYSDPEGLWKKNEEMKIVHEKDNKTYVCWGKLSFS